MLSGLVWYYDKLLTPFFQPHSLWNNTITGYNGACAKVRCFYRATLCISAVFAVGRCLSVCPPRSRIVSRWLKISSNMFFGPVAPSF